MKWITRERPKIDRIACPWLIKRFIDPEAIFYYVPFEQVLSKAKEFEATPYDIPGVEYTQYEDRCTFDFFLERYEMEDPALKDMADQSHFNRIFKAHTGQNPSDFRKNLPKK